MSQETFDDVLNRARKLSPEEQQQLVTALKQDATADNGAKETFRSLGDALKARGFIGSMQDAPHDLATNPKHMEGFGEHSDQ